MELAEYIRGIESAINGLETEVERLCVVKVQSSITLIKNRSINDGIFVGGDKGRYAKYSTNVYPTWFLKGKELNAAGADYIKKNALGNWDGFKEAQGRGSDNVNLSYSNRFWTDLGIQSIFRGKGMTIVRTGVNDPEVEKYAKYLAMEYGTFFIPTDDEKRDLSKDFAVDMTNFVLNKLR